MKAAAEQVRASSPGERALIRRFSEQEASRTDYPNVVHAVAAYGNQEREVEAAKWRAQFDDKQATRCVIALERHFHSRYSSVGFSSSKVQLERLGVVAKELQKILQAFSGAGTGKDWRLKDGKETVEEARKTWEGKKRMISGKPQKINHDVMCNLDTHSGLLCMLPQSNNYVALVAGAIKTIVKASVRHWKNIEMLTRSLKEANDEAHACLVDKYLIKSEAVQTAIAKFYVELFLFYGDVIKWYESSSSRKFWHSLQDNFSDRFENALTNLHRLSQLVMRAAVSGQGAELRVTRLAVEDVNKDLRAGLSGIAHDNAEIRLTQDRLMLGLKHLANPETMQRKNTQLWHQVGLSGTALLLGQKENEDPKNTEDQVAITSSAFQVSTKASDQQLSNEYLEDEPSEIQPTIHEIRQSMEPFLDILIQGVRVVDTNFPLPMAFDNRVFIALERWTLSQRSTILYLEFLSMSIGRHSPQVTAAACKTVNSAAQLSIPVISFFCSRPTFVPQPAGHHTS
ncbi:MAG: hypothetical protein Q9214_004935 [Letrouitia sp. 1 TL-2023]